MKSLVAVRASSLAELFDCPARWEAKNLLGMRLPASSAACLGTAIHASTGAFDESHLPGGSQLTADDTADVLADSIYRPDEDVAWDDLTPRAALRIGLSLHSRYCTEVAPLQGYIGVEVTCEALEIIDLGLVLTGTTDRVRRLIDGRLGITDLKSGSRAVSADGTAVTQGHAPQTGVYELLAENAIGQRLTAPAQIVGLNTGKTPTSQRIGTGEIENARAALIGTDGDPGLLHYASRIIHSGDFFGNPRSNLCSAKYCPRHSTCKFKG